MTSMNVIKVWYQNDWGQYGRRNERLCQSLIHDSRVSRVIHIEPPRSGETGSSPAPTGETGQAAFTIESANDDGVELYVPRVASGAEVPWTALLSAMEEKLLNAGVFEKPTLLWLSAPGALGDLMLRVMGRRFTWIVAEIEDDHRQYAAKGSEAWLGLQQRYERAIRHCDVMISNARAPLREFEPLQPEWRWLPSAVDCKRFEGFPVRPPETGTRPRIVYVGQLGIRMRVDLLQAVAEAFPQATLVLAGGGADRLPPALVRRSNVECPGRVAPDDVPALLCGADVLIMPHEVNALTESMDPQKLYEYLASGRPIVSTPVAGARERPDLVRLADTTERFVKEVRAALSETDEMLAQKRRHSVDGNNWGRVAAKVLDAALAVERPGARRRKESELQYFDHDRPEIRQQIPADAREILDVGCGTGSLGYALRCTRSVRVVGVELSELAARRARERLDDVIVGDAVTAMEELAAGSFDCVVFADILEHLADPENALRAARRLLREDGSIVVSLPNVGHWSVLRQLLQGEWRYEEAGILDRTHLRFFTRKSAERLLQEAGFRTAAHRPTQWSDDRMPVAIAEALLSQGVLDSVTWQETGAHQHLFVAVPERSSVEAVRDAAPEVSVIIPVCNAASYTDQCLAELQRRDQDVSREIIVVDNGSTDDTQRVLEKYPDVRVLRNEDNRGFAVAVNQGVAAARTEALCVLNNDTLVSEGWLSSMLRVLRSERGVAMVGPCSNYANGLQQIELKTANERPTDEMWQQVRQWGHEHAGEVWDVPFLSGFCFLVSRAVWNERGGLPEVYGAGTFEDTEFCRGLRAHGYRLLVARDAYVYHFGNRTFQALARDVMVQQRENQKLFLSRHADDPGLHARLAAESREWGAALKWSRLALRRSPKDLDAWVSAAVSTLALGDPSRAAGWLRQYLEACPEDPRARKALADCLAPSPKELPSGDGRGRNPFRLNSSPAVPG